MQTRSAKTSAAYSVVELGRIIAAHLGSQQIVVSTNAMEESWTSFSGQVRSLCAVEEGLQYVSVVRKGVTLFHEQRGSLGAGGQTYEDRINAADEQIGFRRELLNVANEAVPVVIFTSDVKGEDGEITTVEVAIKRDILEREGMNSEVAIARMFKVTIATIIISFSVCAVLVVWMMKREQHREQRRREEEHLAFAGVMANGIVHDFRNPMSSLKLDVQMMEKEVAKDDVSSEKLGKLAKRAVKTIDRMDKVFEEFLYVSKSPVDKREALDFKSCVTECVTILEPRLQQKGTSLEVRHPEQDVKVLVYRASFQRALMNVMLNAEQFVPEKAGEIVLDYRIENGMAVIDVLDNGPGVKPDDMERIFEMFESGRPGGTGLGLFFAKTAIVNSKGSIAVSNRETGGAGFRIMVPLAEENES
ncbi:hypothetical protein BVX97_05355 [bacterium E08(2017)]|nr:hypothetical protein BVX97_05355 [bacterium E08(2017)]